jgi:hypothetical protein
MGQQFASKGLVRDAATVWRLNGSIRDLDKDKSGEFKIWFDSTDASAIPIRFEFKPKSFLKLAFEQDSKADGPKFGYVIRKQQT